MNVALILGSMHGLPKECPLCGEEYEVGKLIHVECIKKKHGGVLPEGFQELIDTFELDGKKELPKS